MYPLRRSVWLRATGGLSGRGCRQRDANERVHEASQLVFHATEACSCPFAAWHGRVVKRGQGPTDVRLLDEAREVIEHAPVSDSIPGRHGVVQPGVLRFADERLDRGRFLAAGARPVSERLDHAVAFVAERVRHGLEAEVAEKVRQHVQCALELVQETLDLEYESRVLLDYRRARGRLVVLRELGD
jgi:hypothetical protein